MDKNLVFQIVNAVGTNNGSPHLVIKRSLVNVLDDDFISCLNYCIQHDLISKRTVGILFITEKGKIFHIHYRKKLKIINFLKSFIIHPIVTAIFVWIISAITPHEFYFWIKHLWKSFFG